MLLALGIGIVELLFQPERLSDLPARRRDRVSEGAGSVSSELSKREVDLVLRRLHGVVRPHEDGPGLQREVLETRQAWSHTTPRTPTAHQQVSANRAPAAKKQAEPDGQSHQEQYEQGAAANCRGAKRIDAGRAR